MAEGSEGIMSEAYSIRLSNLWLVGHMNPWAPTNMSQHACGPQRDSNRSDSPSLKTYFQTQHTIPKQTLLLGAPSPLAG